MKDCDQVNASELFLTVEVFVPSLNLDFNHLRFDLEEHGHRLDWLMIGHETVAVSVFNKHFRQLHYHFNTVFV